MKKNDDVKISAERFMHNGMMKVLSILLSVLIWMVVVNINNPSQTVTISGIPIQIVNDDVLKNEGSVYRIVGSQRASVRVNARRSITSSLKSSDFTAIADFNNIFRMNQVPVTVTCQNTEVSPSNITLLTTSLEIEMESIKSKTVKVEVLTVGAPAEGYTIGEISTNRNSVTVTAPESLIDKLRSATMTVNVDGASQSLNVTRELVLRDAYGIDLLGGDEYSLSDVELSVNMVRASIEILNTTSVGLSAVVKDTNRVAPGYRYTGVTIKPEKINVSGLKATLAAISSIEIQDDQLTVNGATENVTVVLDINNYLPDGVYLTDNNSGRVSVTMRIEELEQRTIQMPTKDITVNNVPEGLEYSFVSETYSLTVSGLGGDIDLLGNGVMKASVDLASHDHPGEYNLIVKVELPDDFTQLGTSTVRVRILSPETEPEGGTASDTSEAGETGSADEADIAADETEALNRNGAALPEVTAEDVSVSTAEDVAAAGTDDTAGTHDAADADDVIGADGVTGSAHVSGADGVTDSDHVTGAGGVTGSDHAAGSDGASDSADMAGAGSAVSIYDVIVTESIVGGASEVII